MERTSRRDAIIGAGTGLLAAAANPVRCAQAQPMIATPAPRSQVSSSTPINFAQVTKPASGVIMPEGYVRALAQFAYVWGWPLVNMVNRRASIIQAPVPGLIGGIVPVAPRGRLAMLVDYVAPEENFVTCPNQDVVYGNGFFALDAEPVIIQVPDFGDRFWVYALYDNRSDQFGRLGKPYATKLGFYLLAGPNWRGQTPPGVNAVVRAPTELANAIPRIFLNDTVEDRAAVRPLINQVVAYPLAEFDGQMKTMDYAALPHFPAPPQSAEGGETKWVAPEKFFEMLPTVLDNVPPLPGEEAIYANFRQLVTAAHSDPGVAKLLTDTAVASEREIVSPFFERRRNGVPAGDNWNRSKHNAEFGIDYFSRLGTANRTCSRIDQPRRNTSTAISTSRAINFRARTAMRSLSPPTRRRPSRASGRSRFTTTNTCFIRIRSTDIRSAQKTRRSSATTTDR